MLLLLGSGEASAAAVSVAPYGTMSTGERVVQATLTNDRGMTVKIISVGAVITDVVVPDRRGHRDNVVLGFGNLGDYEEKNADYEFGAVVGRYAGRIAGGRFSLRGKTYTLAANDGRNTLHGGPGGFSRKVWRVTPFRRGRAVGALLHLDSPESSQGFPGALGVDVRYTLQPDNSLRIDYQATTDRPTVINLTNHSYFNLAGAGSGTALNHRLQIVADRFVETDQGGIPTGRFPEVAGTPFDFRQPTRIGDMINRPHPQMAEQRGFNHAWLMPTDGRLGVAARVSEPTTGRTLEVLTREPSVTLYTANYFSGRDIGAQGTAYFPHYALALETMHLAESPNRPAFPTTEITPGHPYRSTTIFRFGVQK